MNRATKGLAICLALGVFLACGEPDAPPVSPTDSEAGGAGAAGGFDGEIHIGVAAPMTGSAAAFGAMIKKACDLKAKEVNAAGGVRGKRVVLHFEDDKGDVTEAVNVARKLANDPRIVLVIGHFNSSCSNAAKDTYNRMRVVQFTPASTNVSVCKGSPYTFRNIYRDDFQGIFVANYAKKALGRNRVAVFYDNDDYGKGLMESFTQEAERLGLGLATRPIAYNRERTQDFKALLNPLLSAPPDLIFVAGLYNEAALIAKAARQDLGMQADIIGGDGVMENDFIRLGGQAAEGAFVVSPFLFNTGEDSPEAKALVAAFQAEYGHDPDTWSALTYDAISQSLVAIEEVGADRAAIKEWFDACNTPERGYVGVTGNTYFNEDGDCHPKLTFVATVRDGSFVPAEKQIAPEELGA